MKRLTLVAMLFFSTGCTHPSQQDIPEEFKGLSAEEINQKGMVFHREQKFEESLRLFRFSTQKDPSYYKGFFNQACSLSMLNKPTEAMQELEKAASLNSAFVYENRLDSDLAGIRSLPSFQELMNRIHPSSVFGRWMDATPSDVARLPEPYNLYTAASYEGIEFKENGEFAFLSSSSRTSGTFVQNGNQITLNYSMQETEMRIVDGRSVGGDQSLSGQQILTFAILRPDAIESGKTFLCISGNNEHGKKCYERQ